MHRHYYYYYYYYYYRNAQYHLTIQQSNVEILC